MRRRCNVLLFCIQYYYYFFFTRTFEQMRNMNRKKSTHTYTFCIFFFNAILPFVPDFSYLFIFAFKVNKIRSFYFDLNPRSFKMNASTFFLFFFKINFFFDALWKEIQFIHLDVSFENRFSKSNRNANESDRYDNNFSSRQFHWKYD